MDPKIAVIGAGPCGIAAGVELLKQGFENFTIFEKEKAAGGTWHSHSYPGLACDVWAHSYTFSYAPNPDWSETFVSKDEIESYLQDCAKAFGLAPFMVFNKKITSAKWQVERCWTLSIENEAGESTEEDFDIVINAMGNQHTPVFPDIDGIDSNGRDVFKGESWHSTNWRHDVDLQGKNIVLVGSAAAAIQIVPEIAKVAGHLTVMQRTPNWILPRNNGPYSPALRKVFKRFPLLMRGLRGFQGKLMGLVHYAVTNENRMMGTFENLGRKLIEKSIEDPELRKKVTPDYSYGCKRPLVSDDFYPALNRDNVSLIAEGAKAIKENGVETEGGVIIDADVIVYCTGYRILDYDRIKVTGKKDLLAERMGESPEAYKGLLVPGFPNYFFGLGPNAVVISVSYFKSIEANIKNIVNLMSEMRTKNVKAIDAKSELNKAYNQWVIENCQRFSWGSGGCNTYYVNDEGRSPFLYPDTYKAFLKMRAQCGIGEFDKLI